MFGTQISGQYPRASGRNGGASLLWVIIPLHPWHQIKGSSLHQRLIVNLIITYNYNYLMVGAQIIVINLLGRQFGKGCQYLNGPKQTLQASLFKPKQR